MIATSSPRLDPQIDAVQHSQRVAPPISNDLVIALS